MEIGTVSLPARPRTRGIRGANSSSASIGTAPGRSFAAEIDDVRAGGLHGKCSVHGARGIEPLGFGE